MVLYHGLLVIIFVLLSSGCQELPPEHRDASENLGSVVIDQITIPVLPTSEEQFNYTRSWFAERRVKRAALKAYIQLHPEQKKYCGMAALDLAYLQLGDDYRFAHEKSYFAALESYNTVLAEYSDFPSIMAKALWYIGWISTDLLYDREKGLAAYRRVVEEFPHEHVFLLPPAPWVSIIYPPDQQGGRVVYAQPRNSWAALALVEMIKHTEDQEAAWNSFVKLWHEHRGDVATGFGLRLVLQRRYHVNETRAMAMEYMERDLSNIHILSDIREELNAIDRGRGVSGNED